MIRFTIRDLLWLTILMAVLVAWWLQWRQDVIARHRDAEAIRYLKQQVAKPPAMRVRIYASPPQQLPGRLRFPPDRDYQAPPTRPARLNDSSKR